MKRPNAQSHPETPHSHSLTGSLTHLLTHSLTHSLPFSLMDVNTRENERLSEPSKIDLGPSQRDKRLKEWAIIQSRWQNTIFNLWKVTCKACHVSPLAFKHQTLLLGECTIQALSLNAAGPWCDPLITALATRMMFYSFVNDTRTVLWFAVLQVREVLQHFLNLISTTAVCAMCVCVPEIWNLEERKTSHIMDVWAELLGRQ